MNNAPRDALQAASSVSANDLSFQPRPSLVLAILSLAGILIAGCETAPRGDYLETVPLPPGPGSANYATNVLQEGDVVSITFQYSTNFNAVGKITLDGQLNLESVGPVKAAGKTPIELQAELAKLYKPQIKDDVVTVKLVSSVASIYVSGAVFRPGKVAMERPLTILEAVMEAGGFDPNRAHISNITVIRLENGGQHTYHVNLKKILQGDEPAPFYLRPFDVVHVPTKTFNF